jgi:PAS domain S-box-containing protein
MSWDWVIDTAKVLIAGLIAWSANQLRKQAKPMVEAIKKLGNIVKIVNRFETKQAIITSEQLAFYHISKNPIYIIDERGAITYVNPAWVNMAGFRDDREAYGLGYLRAVHPDDREELERQRAMLEKVQSSFQGVVRFKNLQTGAIIYADCSSELVYDDKGKVVKTIGILYIRPDKDL